MERWVVAAKRADFAAIGKEFGIDPVIARLIRNRDIQDRDEIRRYLYGKVDELASPHLMKDVDKAVEVLREKNFAVMSTDVVCLSCANVPGSLAVVLEYLAEEQIFIEYMYAFAQADQALEAHHCHVLAKEEL